MKKYFSFLEEKFAAVVALAGTKPPLPASSAAFAPVRRAWKARNEQMPLNADGSVRPLFPRLPFDEVSTKLTVRPMEVRTLICDIPAK